MLLDLWDQMKGHKTYVAAAGFALLALYETLDGDYPRAGEYALLALGMLGLRHAMDG